MFIIYFIVDIMTKKISQYIYTIIFTAVIASVLHAPSALAQDIKWFDDVGKYYWNTDTIWTENILNTEDLDNPIKAWAKDLWPNSINGISDDKSTDREWSKDNVLKIIQRVINYVLWFLAMISLILIIYNWFVLLLSPKDENTKKAKEIIVKIIRAIWGIWISWIIISSIFWVIAKFGKWW